MRARKIRAWASLVMAGLVLGWMPLAAMADPGDEPEPVASAEAAPAEEAPEPKPEPAPEPVSKEPSEPATTSDPHDRAELEPAAADPDPLAAETVESVASFAAAVDDPAPTATASDPSEAEPAVTGGALRWGLKESFRSYILGPIAQGSITFTPPAAADAAVISYPATSGTWPSQVKTGGGVRYLGHGGQLDLTLSNLRLQVGSTVVLLVDARSSDGISHPGLRFASVDLAGAVSVSEGTVTISGAATRLTAAGAAVFAYDGSPMYPPGAELDPLSLTLQVEGGVPVVPTAPPEPVENATPAPTPSATTTPSTPVPTPTPSETTAKPAKPRGGSLSWGVKSSFRSYVTGPIAKGAITVSGGAGASGGGYKFGQSSTTADLPDADGATRYKGKVRFTGHHGELDLTFSDPAVRVSGSSGVLSVSATGQGRIDIANLDLGSGKRSTSGRAVTYSGVPATLTKAGVKVFSYDGNAFYEAGARLDSVSFTIGSRSSVASGTKLVAAAATPSATPTPSASPTATATSAAPDPEATTSNALTMCPAVEATLSWGFKESFRAYVSGMIANGDWTTSGNASYTTPLFTWSAGAGGRSPEGPGELDFTGGIRFTGHDGLLDSTVANPTVRFDGPDAATLVVDYTGTSMDDAMAGKENRQELARVPFVELDLAEAAAAADGDLTTLSDIPATLTAEGSAAFPNYPAGTAFDPVTLSYRLGADCTTVAPEASTPAETPAAPEATDAPSELPPPAGPGRFGWVPWVGGGLIGAVIASGATVLVMRRRGGVG